MKGKKLANWIKYSSYYPRFVKRSEIEKTLRHFKDKTHICHFITQAFWLWWWRRKSLFFCCCLIYSFPWDKIKKIWKSGELLREEKWGFVWYFEWVLKEFSMLKILLLLSFQMHSKNNQYFKLCDFISDLYQHMGPMPISYSVFIYIPWRYFSMKMSECHIHFPVFTSAKPTFLLHLH